MSACATEDCERQTLREVCVFCEMRQPGFGGFLRYVWDNRWGMRR